MSMPDSVLPSPTEPTAAPQDAPTGPAAGLLPSLLSWLRLDALLVGLVLLEAFLVSSFLIRNSDFWFHLASGRLLLTGKYTFGVDPFCYTTEGVYWTNHSWLYDALLYLLYQNIGATGLVLLKAGLVTALAWVLLRIGTSGRSPAAAAGCTALALLAMSTHLSLQPVLLSCFLLSVVLGLLWRYQDSSPGQAPLTSTQEARLLAGVLGCMVLWVNVDSWFLLGPFVVALFWIGSWFDPRVRYPSWLFPGSLAVCLLNPHHAHVFRLPAELSSVGWTSDLRLDPRFQALYLSPWMMGAHLQPLQTCSLADWAYFLLLALGLASFVLVRRQLTGWRVVVWLGLALVGSWQTRLTPFFIVAAAPITALNFQQWLHDRSAIRPGFALLGRLTVLAGCLGLILLTWRGWLHGFRSDGRRIAWGEQPNPSLQHAAEELQRWREQELLPADAPVLAIHPEAAHYCAWFAPEVKSFLDHRIPLFPQAAGELVAVCQALDPDWEGIVLWATNSESPQEKLERILRGHGIRHLLIYDPDLRRLMGIHTRLAANRRDWALLRIDGQAALFGWNDGDPGRHEALTLDPGELAFGPDEKSLAPIAPGQGPARGPAPPLPWMLPGTRLAPPTWESPAATMYLATFEARSPRAPSLDRSRSLACFSTALVGVPALSSSPLPLCTILGAQLELPSPDRERKPGPALPLLAIRMARRALAVGPDDAGAYLALAQGYTFLHGLPTAPTVEKTCPPLAALRHVQIVTALENVVRLRPDLALAHLWLTDLYSQRGYLDAALAHQRAVVYLQSQAAGPSEQAQELAQHQRRLDELDQLVQERKSAFAEQAASLGDDPLPRARLAAELGLVNEALDILLPSHDRLDGPGYRLEMDLLLQLGRVEQARERMERAVSVMESQGDGIWIEIAAPGRRDRPLRLSASNWLRLCLHAARGDYDEADTHVQSLIDHAMLRVRSNIKELAPQMRNGLIALLGLNAQRHWPLSDLAELPVSDVFRSWQTTSLLQSQQAELMVVAAMLALERGEPAAAQRSFQEALKLYQPERSLGMEFAAQGLALTYLRLLTIRP